MALSPEVECNVLALKPLAALFDEAVRTTFSKTISHIGLMISSMTVDLPHPPPPTEPIRGKPRSFGSLYCCGELLNVAPGVVGCRARRVVGTPSQFHLDNH